VKPCRESPPLNSAARVAYGLRAVRRASAGRGTFLQNCCIVCVTDDERGKEREHRIIGMTDWLGWKNSADTTQRKSLAGRSKSTKLPAISFLLPRNVTYRKNQFAVGFAGYQLNKPCYLKEECALEGLLQSEQNEVGDDEYCIHNTAKLKKS
jgi:hypothetical protein